MNAKPLLHDIVQKYFIKRLIVPLGFLSFLAISVVTALELRDLYISHKLFVKTMDRYIGAVMSAAHGTLRGNAFAAEESEKSKEDFLISSPVEFHRVFVFKDMLDTKSDGEHDLPLPASVDIPFWLFPDLQEWPALSIPYFNRRLNAMTLGVLVRADRWYAFGELNLERVERLLRDFSESAPENLILVLDRFGNVIYHHDPQLMRSQENLRHQPLVRRAIGYSQPRFLMDRLDSRWMFAYCWTVAPWNWVIIVGKPAVQALLPPVLWSVGGIALLFLAVFSLLIASKRHVEHIIVRPIMHLRTQWDAFSRYQNTELLKKAADTAPFFELHLLAEELHRSSQAVLDREAALIAQGRELHRVLESIGDAVIVTDAAGRIVRMNARAERITGWSRVQALGRSVDRILSISDAKSGKPLQSLDQLVLATGAAQIRSGYGLLHAADESSVVVRHSAAPIRDDAGTLQGVVMVLRDATAEYEAQRLLEESERKYRHIMETMKEGYFELEPNGRVSFCNQATLNILGCSWEELQQRTYRDFADEATGQQMYSFFSRIFASGSSAGLQDFTIQDMRGQRKTVEISVGVRRAEDGQPIGFRVLARDITEKMQALEQSRRLEKMLLQTQKMESLGTLASGIAHEFNNLLQAMSGYLEMALSHTDAHDPRSRWLSRVQEAAFRARDLIRRLLSFARQTEPVPEPMSFNDVVEDTLDLLKKSIHRMIEIQKDLAPNLPVLVADRLQVEQVLINLTANARDAIGSDNPGVIYLQTGTYTDENGQVWIQLKVQDTGSGIPEEIQDRIFDPFFTTKEPGKGTGLGLSTVYGIVANHGGRIRCDSQPGHGTTFYVDFPVKDRAVDTSAQEPERTVAEEVSPPSGATLLVVDDEPMLLELLQGLLESVGWRVRTAGSGEEALRCLAQNNGSVQAVVLDLSMPGMGGRRCLEILRSQYPHLPVIVASGDASHEIFRDPESYGARECITKPYRLQTLMEALKKVLHSSSS